MSAYDKSTVSCPYCQFPMECDWVDVGVGLIQCGPYCCDNCGASEIGPERYRDIADYTGPGCLGSCSDIDTCHLDIDADEKRTGFYKNRISPHANQHNGQVISHKQADALYRAKYFAEHGNPYNAKIHR